jgi:succinate dehydrogenase flavin-adding protein (antitoxin of CptAB toxin-antitoxin module)
MIDEVRWKRLRWRCRRGMLENDIVLTRWLDAVEASGARLAEHEVETLDRLLDLPDNALWDLLSGRCRDEDPPLQHLVDLMRDTPLGAVRVIPDSPLKPNRRNTS